MQPQHLWPKPAEGASADLAPFKPVQSPANEALNVLGETLFFDPGLSKDGSVSCGSCHKAQFAFADNRPISPGVGGRLGRRNAPSLLHVSLWQTLFYDGRSEDLHQQILEPLQDPNEMDSNPALATKRVAEQMRYAALFYNAFGDGQISWLRIVKAIVSFQQSLHSSTVFEEFMQAIEAQQFEQAAKLLTKNQIAGMHLFRTKAGCIRCHNGPLLSDQRFHVTGLHMQGRKWQDLGRYEFTQREADRGAFRTPMLRNVSKTAPWMHHGLFPSLKGIINFYSRIDRVAKNAQKDPSLPALSDKLEAFELSKQERQQLFEFLQIL